MKTLLLPTLWSFLTRKLILTDSKKQKKKTNLNDAVVTGTGKVDGEEIACAIMDFEYMGGSMGSVVGEKVTKIMELAIEKRIPVVTITASGGARMQESALFSYANGKNKLCGCKVE